MNKLGWIIGAILVTVTARASFAETTEEVKVQEPAFKTNDKPLINGSHVEVKKPYSPVPIFRQRLANILEQIERGESKGWVTADVASKLKQQRNEIVPLVDRITDAKADKPLVDNIESKITALNADVFAALNKQPTKIEAKKAGSAPKQPAKGTKKQPKKPVKKT